LTRIQKQRIEEDILTDTNEHLLENLQLVENNFVNRAAILLFHYKPENFITGAYVKKYTINERTARRDVIGLVEKGILIRQGDKKSTKYKYR
jgi:Fic family protein